MPDGLALTIVVPGLVVSPSWIVAAIATAVALGLLFSPVRVMSRGRRHATLDAMQTMYAISKRRRGTVLQAMPAFLQNARDELEERVRAADPPRADLVEQLRCWSGVSATAAHEVLASEAKFRALLRAIDAVNAYRAERPDERRELLAAASAMINELNDFSQMVELGIFSQGDVFGQLHRSLAPACKAAEPLILASSSARDGGRSGFRLLRMLIRVEHFNDVKPIHRVSPLTWRRAAASQVVLIRPELFRDDFGRQTPTPAHVQLTRRERVALRLARRTTRLTARYGGRRLRSHARAESLLVGRVRFAVKQEKDPLDFSWTMTSLQGELEERWKKGGRGVESA